MYTHENVTVGEEKCVMLYAIWYHLHNLKNVENTHGGVLLLVKLHSMGVFHIFKIVQMIPNLTTHNDL